MIYIRGRGPVYISSTPCGEEEEECTPVENVPHFSELEGQNLAVVLGCNDEAIHIPTSPCDPCGGATYELSMAGNVITLIGSDGSESSVTLPVYDGGVSP